MACNPLPPARHPSPSRSSEATLALSEGSGWDENQASSISLATAGEVERRLITRTLASFHRRAPDAVWASPHRAALHPLTLLAAIDAPVPVQQKRTPQSASPEATLAPTACPTAAHCRSSPAGGPTATTSCPRPSRSLQTASVS